MIGTDHTCLVQPFYSKSGFIRESFILANIHEVVHSQIHEVSKNCKINYL